MVEPLAHQIEGQQVRVKEEKVKEKDLQDAVLSAKQGSCLASIEMFAPKRKRMLDMNSSQNVRFKARRKSENSNVYCISNCQIEGDSEWIGCENKENCVSYIEGMSELGVGGGDWFHLSCVNMKGLPRGKWFCKSCTSTSSLKGFPGNGPLKLLQQYNTMTLTSIKRDFNLIHQHTCGSLNEDISSKSNKPDLRDRVIDYALFFRMMILLHDFPSMEGM